MRETLIRLLSGIVYVLLLTAAIFFSPVTFLLLFGIFLALAVFEFCALVNLRWPIPLAFAIAAYYLFGYLPVNYLNALLLLLGALVVSLKCILYLFDDHLRMPDTVSKYVYLIGYIIIPFILVSKIPFQYELYQPKIVMSVFIIIWANDTFAFLIGKTMGKNKLFEKISPKKTIEGFIGGLGFAMFAGLLIARYFISDSWVVWTLLAFVVSVTGTLGDLVQSKFKRAAKVKDSGKIMPGHGGILDRLDSVIFAAPFVFLFYQIVNYVS